MIKLMDLLTEGVYDKGIFKAVFMAGGPGSGKSFMASNIFGIPEKQTTSISGLKVVNSDKQFMHILKKFGFDPTMLAKYPDELFSQLSDPVGVGSGTGLRDFAQDIKNAERSTYMDGKLGMIIDSTGSNFQKVKKQKKALEAAGYDTYMVFVMTSLETAQKRNKLRAEKGERELPEDIVKKSWKATRKNLGGLKALFGRDFALVYNDKHLDAKEARHAFANLTKSYANTWINGNIKNPIGQQWVKDTKRLKKYGLDKGIPKPKRSKGIGYK